MYPSRRSNRTPPEYVRIVTAWASSPGSHHYEITNLGIVSTLKISFLYTRQTIHVHYQHNSVYFLLEE
jgi:hypothetical protein